jgi:hypothetical protein
MWSPRGFHPGRTLLVDKVESRILENKEARTQYITIPARMVQDSQYPFKANDTVELEIQSEEKRLVVRLLRRGSTAAKK